MKFRPKLSSLIPYLLVIFIGIGSVVLGGFFNIAIFDPLLVALILGMTLRSFIGFDKGYLSIFKRTQSIFIPIGVIFYGAVNLNFLTVTKIDLNFVFILFIVFLTYIISIFILSNIFRVGEKTMYLIGAGSTICGASAIAITSKAVDAEPDEISISLVAVFIVTLIGIFVVFPIVKNLMSLSSLEYSVLSGSVLQFTGAVKAALKDMPSKIMDIGLSIKAVRYLGLLLIVPLFASFVKGRLYIPWFLWVFFISGLLCTFCPGMTGNYRVFLKTSLNITWSIAMASIGLAVNLKDLISKNGIKALLVSMASFLIATGVFLTSLVFMR
ncbi:MAG: putative sulfate exporter family transporter [Candidatus Omnitrophota bacterium]